jgi:pimeloyl-ACP methyl ester carboxylesterase
MQVPHLTTPLTGNQELAALPAHCEHWNSPTGMLAMYEAHPYEAPTKRPSAAERITVSQVPLLLVHSVNAAGSAAEMAPLFAHYRSHRSVYALDLPGFGSSERSNRVYTPRLMTDAVLAALERIQVAHGTAVDVAAISLATEFAARAQTERPELVRRMALISPTGFSGKRRRQGPHLSNRGMPWLHSLLSNPIWSEALYRGLTRPGVVRYFLERTWGSKDIDEALWAFDMQITRQQGAHYAPLYFLAACLFSADIHTVYEAVTCPVWVSMATRGDFTDYRGAQWFIDRKNWVFHTVAGGALPYFEDTVSFTAKLDAFWSATAE